MPRKFVDAQLPLTLAPKPSSVARVFVDRLEALSPESRATIERALSTGEIWTLAKFGRFLDPFYMQIRQANSALAAAPRAEDDFQNARNQAGRDNRLGACIP